MHIEYLISRIIKKIENREILLADIQTQNKFPTLDKQGLILEDEFAANIGGIWFYCAGNCNGKLLRDYKLKELAQMIANVINNPDEYGIGECEADFYKSFIE